MSTLPADPPQISADPAEDKALQQWADDGGRAG